MRDDRQLSLKVVSGLRRKVVGLLEYGVDTRAIAQRPGATGHAIIAVDAGGENNILLWPGTNGAITDAMVGQALAQAPQKVHSPA